jgi:hypothetical protein
VRSIRAPSAGSRSRRRRLMALTTGILGAGPGYVICPADHASLLDGMVPMYLLMSAVHSPPWLKLISSRSRRSTQSR